MTNNFKSAMNYYIGSPAVRSECLHALSKDFVSTQLGAIMETLKILLMCWAIPVMIILGILTIPLTIILLEQLFK